MSLEVHKGADCTCSTTCTFSELPTAHTCLSVCVPPALPLPTHRPRLSDGSGRSFFAELLANTWDQNPNDGVLVYRPSMVLTPASFPGCAPGPNPGPAPTPVPVPSPGNCGSVLDQIRSNPSLSTLASLIDSNGLTPALADHSGSVFAPTNEVSGVCGSGTGVCMCTSWLRLGVMTP